MTVGDVHEPSPARDVCLLLAVGATSAVFLKAAGYVKGTLSLGKYLEVP